MRTWLPGLLALVMLFAPAAGAQTPPASPSAPPPPPQAPPAAYDAALAERLGADDYGMHAYVLVLLRTGPHPMAAGPERDAMFQAHFANIKRLADEGKLILAGPFDGVDGWRGMFIFAVKDIEEAKRLASTDPVLAKGEMVAEYHRYYGSAALMLVPETHARLAKKRF